MARRKTAESGDENKTKVTTIPADQADFQYKRDRAQTITFAKMQEILQRNPMRNVNKTFTQYTKDLVKTYLQSPNANQDTLREISRFLARNSMLYQKILMHYASIPLFNYNITPQDDFLEQNDYEKIIKNYQKVISTFNRFDIKKEGFNALYFALRDGFYVGYVYDDKQGRTFLMPLDVQYIRILGKNLDGQWVAYFNAAYFDAGNNKEFVQGINGDNKTSTWDDTVFGVGYRDYKTRGRDYQWFRLPPEKTCILLSCAEDEFMFPLPFFTAIFTSLMDLLDLEQLIANRNELENYKLIISKIPLVDNGNSGDVDDFAISLELSKFFNDLLASSVPETVSVAYSPMDIEVVNFEQSNSSDNTDRLNDSINNLFENAGASKIAVSGGGANPSTLAIKYGMVEDQNITWVWVNRLESWYNYYIKSNISKGYIFEIHKISDFNKEEYINIRKEAATLGNNKMDYITSIVETPYVALQKLRFENMMGLSDLMVPLQSSYQNSNDNNVGRPRASDDQVSPSADRTRNKSE